MRRQNRKWVAIGVGLYLFVMWSAFRWSIAQRPTDGPLLDHIEREEVRKAKEREAREAAAKAEPQLSPTGQFRLESAGPAYVAAKYDDTHVVFIVANQTEARFANAPALRSAAPRRVSASLHPSAPLAGLQELWEPDTQALHFFPAIVQQTQPGDSWMLSAASGGTIPVAIERVIVAPTGCSLALGFLAAVPHQHESAFHGPGGEYFVVRRSPVELATPPASSHVGEIPGWKSSHLAAKQMEQQLNERMRAELSQIDARLLANAASPGQTTLPLPIGDARPRLKEWLHADNALVRGEGALDYDLRAFRLTPDGSTRLFVRARWTLAGAPVFLMTAWFRSDSAHPDASPVLLWTDTSWSEDLRNGEAPLSLGDRLDFQTILNEFDDDHDGWAELLIHSYDSRSDAAQPKFSSSTSIALYLYTDKGLVPLKTPFRRDERPPESCLQE